MRNLLCILAGITLPYVHALRLPAAIEDVPHMTIDFIPPVDKDNNQHTTHKPNKIIVPIATQIDLSPKERSVFYAGFGGIVILDPPKNFWHAKVSGGPPDADYTVCHPSYDPNGAYQRYTYAEIMSDHHKLEQFKDPDLNSESELSEDAIAVFCGAYYTRWHQRLKQWLTGI